MVFCLLPKTCFVCKSRKIVLTLFELPSQICQNYPSLHPPPKKKSFLNGPTLASFSFILVFFKQTIQFLQQINVKMSWHPVYGVRIRTHELSTMSGLPLPLNQGSRPNFFVKPNSRLLISTTPLLNCSREWCYIRFFNKNRLTKTCNSKIIKIILISRSWKARKSKSAYFYPNCKAWECNKHFIEICQKFCQIQSDNV